MRENIIPSTITLTPTARMHSQGVRFAVIDDFLPGKQFSAAADAFDDLRLNPVLSSIDPIYDGPAYLGDGGKSSLRGSESGTPPWQRILKEQVCVCLGIWAATSADALCMTLSGRGYPAESRLGWHNDGADNRVGAYVYFAHRNWSASWGGGLTLIDEEAPQRVDGIDLLDSATHPVSIFPRPNRLVIFRSHTMHAVQRVDPTAGDRLRKTWTGFVVKDPNGH
ncbi:2OG-Fe(II) oxygenase [Streptomyces sp. NPDC088748]|uniref:2OG-Fe(II) oxygenase n=1 Tax=unclassified Streptomyces TaxID=2593676 RepID=UPI0009A50586